MKNLDRHTLAEVLRAEIAAGTADTATEFSGLSIDSRTVRPGELFFAIKGEKHDGHDYIEAAFKRGAAAAVVDRSRMETLRERRAGWLFAVRDTHEALLDLAAYIRRRIDARFAAVTGSNGKTTTKEMLYAIVGTTHAAYRSPGNLNNLYGLPISLGLTPDETEFAIYELGISVPGEMTRLAAIIKPELAVITNIGPAHLETLKSIDNVVKAKFELIDTLPVGATVVLNADDPYLMAEAGRRHLKFIGFGLTQKTDFVAADIRAVDHERQEFSVDGNSLMLSLPGRVNLYNALAAIAASSVWGLGPQQWREGLLAFQPVDMRMRLEEYKGLNLFIDCYNANPDSIAAALETLRDLPATGRRIAVLADMLELGDQSERLHREAGRRAAQSGLDYLFTLGAEARLLARSAADNGLEDKQIFSFDRQQDLLDALLSIVAPGDLILFKGSRGMEVEKIVFGLKGAVFAEN